MRVGYVTYDLSINTPLFEQPTDEVNKDTVFRRPTVKYAEQYLPPPPDPTPVNVQVNGKVSDLSTLNSSTSNFLDSAKARNSVIKAYVGATVDLAKELADLADKAKESTATSTDRAAYQERANEILSLFDKYYANASYGTEKIMQGGGGTMSGGTDGNPISYTFGNADRVALGLTSIDLTSKSSAESSASAISAATAKLQVQSAQVSSEGEILSSRAGAINSSTGAVKMNTAVDVEYNYAMTVMNNVQAALGQKMQYALNIQGEQLRTTISTDHIDALKRISKTISDLQSAQEKEAQDKAKIAADEKSAETPAAETQGTNPSSSAAAVNALQEAIAAASASTAKDLAVTPTQSTPNSPLGEGQTDVTSNSFTKSVTKSTSDGTTTTLSETTYTGSTSNSK